MRPAVDAFFDKVSVNAPDPARSRQSPGPPGQALSRSLFDRRFFGDRDLINVRMNLSIC
ncbi:MAG: hypothetical protein MZU79_02915 [Anaerotruncus sp.]|nr:hypothetical protein [Anaerotruncus sp.]